MDQMKNQFNIFLTKKNNISRFIKMDGIIGQEDVMKKLNFFIMNGGSYIPTLLFAGSHGLGKTYIAKKFAHALNRKYVEINCVSITSVDEFMAYLLQNIPLEGATVLLDEAHALRNDIATLLLSILNPTLNNKNHVQYGDCNIEFNLNDINFILATTDGFDVLAPLKNRCQPVYFSSYNKLDILEMLKLYLSGVIFECDKDDLVYACRGRGRDTFTLSNNLRRYLGNNKILTDEGWKEFKDIFSIYPHGLNKEEFELLKVIQENQPISSSNAALLLMVNEKNIKEELEIRLKELNFVKNTTRGRVLTSKGEEYLKGIKDYNCV
jgi:Holliday junction DNA helicase RuvB